MLKKMVLPLVAGACLMLLGCAHSPQVLDLHPALQIKPETVGNQQAVVVQVTDGRDSKVLGTRGGIYPQTSTLQLSEQVLPRLQREVEAAVRALGYMPVPQGTANAGQLIVSLTELAYRVPEQGVYVTQADLTATFSAQASKGSEQYRGRYSASSNHRFATPPNEKKNQQLVSEVMNDALSRLFQDRAIVEVLSR